MRVQLLHNISLIIVILFTFSPIKSQDPDCSLLSLSNSDFIQTILNADAAQKTAWKKDELCRHTIIRRLDNIFDILYSVWIEESNFKQFIADDNNLELIDQLFQFPSLFSNTVEYLINPRPINRFDQASSNLYRADLLRLYSENEDVIFFKQWDTFFEYLEMNGNAQSDVRIKENISWVSNHTTLEYLSKIYEDVAKMHKNLSPFVYSRNKSIISDRVAIVESEEFVHYRSNESSKKAVKEIDFYTDNDVLSIGINQDREYTGGGGLTFTTDYFDSNWLNLGWLRKKHLKLQSQVLKYRTVGLEMHFYTPYIRYKNSTQLADTLYQYDRPFGSYVYVSRNEYRLWPKGLIRNSNSFQLGKIGGKAGEQIQGTLHRDAIISSQGVYGWDRQIVNGGRWLLQLNAQWDWMLYSNVNRYRSVFSKKQNINSDRKLGVNVFLKTKLQLGGFLTAFDYGIHFSTSDFKNQSGQKMLKPFKNDEKKFAIVFDLGISRRRVIHNSMLEGFGYVRTFVDDEYDNEAVSVYTLNEESYKEQNNDEEFDSWFYDRPKTDDAINRNLWLINSSIKLRLRKMVLYWQMNYTSLEYNLESPNYENLNLDVLIINDDKFKAKFESETVKNLEAFKTRNRYAYGTVGISWLL